MHSTSFYVFILKSMTQTFLKRNIHYVITYTFLYYIYFKLKRLFGSKLQWLTISNKNLEHLVSEESQHFADYVDPYTCILGKITYLNNSTPSWCYICCKSSRKKYKVLLIPCENINSDVVCISEVIRHNLENSICFNDSNNTYFLVPVGDDAVKFASEAIVSLIANPYDCTDQLVSTLVENYFAKPRFLRRNDVFAIDIIQYAQEHIYSATSKGLSIYFKVKSLKVGNSGRLKPENDCYIVQGETALLQETNIHSYLPRKYICSLSDKLLHIKSIPELDTFDSPPTLIEFANILCSSILPFTKSDIQLRIKPIFLLKSPQGYGKSKIVQITSQMMGVNLLSVDFAEIQALTSAQTEAKLRIVLHNAKHSMPCILCLNNIQIFGKTSEGQKDERTISAFTREINELYDENLKYPVIIIATSDGSEIPGELQRIFTEIISLENLDQQKRLDIIKWHLLNKGINYEGDLSNVVDLCSDFRYNDLIVLIMHAIKIRCKNVTDYMKHCPTLTEDNFIKAYEYMQLTYTDCKDMPRIPKVYWDDIGGLAELKKEIMRRIRLPLLNAFGFGQSGLLLYGPPGTGKTLLAKAVATEYQLHFLSIKGPEMLNMYVGQSEKNIRQVFERARASAPCIIFFDELDSLAPNRGRSGDSGGVMDRVVSQLLAEMDGLEESSNIFIIGATNRPDLIDPALLRPGRFDKLLYVGIHSERSSKTSVLKALTRKFKFMNNGEELEELVNHLPDNVTGADLYSVCADAWLNASRRLLNRLKNRSEDISTELRIDIVVEMSDLLEAVGNLVPSVSREEVQRYEKMRLNFFSRNSAAIS